MPGAAATSGSRPWMSPRLEPAASPARRWQGPAPVACRAKGLALVACAPPLAPGSATVRTRLGREPPRRRPAARSPPRQRLTQWPRGCRDEGQPPVPARRWVWFQPAPVKWRAKVAEQAKKQHGRGSGREAAAREGSRWIGRCLFGCETRTDPYRTGQIASRLDPTAIGLAGDVAVSTARGFSSKFVIRRYGALNIDKKTKDSPNERN
jgi:hypothetical protein